MRRVNCRRCGIVAVEEVPWGDGKRTLTKVYMLFLARWARRLSWKETAEAFRTSQDKVFDAVEHVVTFGLEHRVLGQIDAIGVDEIQYAKGHKYLTLVYQIDLDSCMGRMVFRPMNASDDLSEMLAELQTGGKEALERITPLVYGELHRIARRVWGTQEPGHTLQPTVLIHEAYMKMVRQKDRTFQSRAHFYAVAAMAMRQVLVNHAEASVAAKRGSKKNSVPLDEELISSFQEESDVLALHDALKSLAEMDPRKGRVVEMRYFGGLNIEETAEALGVSTITVTRDWVAARAWLARELGAT